MDDLMLWRLYITIIIIYFFSFWWSTLLQASWPSCLSGRLHSKGTKTTKMRLKKKSFWFDLIIIFLFQFRPRHLTQFTATSGKKSQIWCNSIKNSTNLKFFFSFFPNNKKKKTKQKNVFVRIKLRIFFFFTVSGVRSSPTSGATPSGCVCVSHTRTDTDRLWDNELFQQQNLLQYLFLSLKDTHTHTHTTYQCVRVLTSFVADGFFFFHDSGQIKHFWLEAMLVAVPHRTKVGEGGGGETAHFQ